MEVVKMRTLIVCVNLIVITLILAPQNDAEIDPESIAGAWLFDEGGGDTTRDSSGKGNDGELVNGPEWVAGKFGKALEFDGKDDSVEVPDNDTLDVTAITLTAWVKSEANLLLDGNVIVYKNPSYIHQYWATTINPGVFVGGQWCGSGWLPQGEIWDDDWHHVALTYDGSTQRFYVDGVFGGENAACKGDIDISASNLTIGTGNVGFYTGSIDEVAVFDVVLDEDDLNIIITEGLRAITAIFPTDKLTTTWGGIKEISRRMLIF
jgi:hypothetical protein